MNVQNLHDFFGHLASVPPKRVPVQQCYIALDGLIQRVPARQFADDVKRAVHDTRAHNLVTPRLAFVQTAISAGIVKAVGRARDDRDEHGRLTPLGDRDFPVALDLAAFSCGLFCAAGSPQAHARAQEELAALQLRRGQWSPRSA